MVPFNISNGYLGTQRLFPSAFRQTEVAHAIADAIDQPGGDYQPDAAGLRQQGLGQRSMAITAQRDGLVPKKCPSAG